MGSRLGMVAAMTAALLIGTGPAAIASAPQTHLTDLGYGNFAKANGLGDIVGYSHDAAGYALWRHDHRTPVALGADIDGIGDVNRLAHVVGHLGAGPGFLWVDGELRPLSHPSGSPIWANAVNDRDEVAGIRGVEDLAPDRPIVWRNGVFEEFPGWQGLHAGEAVDINNRGQVLVNLYTADWSEQHAVLWWHGKVTDLGSLGGKHTWPIAINERGAVLGAGEDADGNFHSFLWQNGKMVDLMPGYVGWNAWYSAINEAGDLAGYWEGHPVLWRHGVVTSLLGDREGSATALNDRGDVAGVTWDPAALIRTPFRWRNGTVTEFENLYPGLNGTWAYAIDNRGRLIGESAVVGGAPHIVVWTVG